MGFTRAGKAVPRAFPKPMPEGNPEEQPCNILFKKMFSRGKKTMTGVRC